MEPSSEKNDPPTLANIFEIKKQEGILKGRMEARLDIARNLLKQNIPHETIAAATKLTLEEVEAIKKEIQ